MAYTQQSIHAIVEKQRAFFDTGATLDVKWRVKQLKKLKQAVLDDREALEKRFQERYPIYKATADVTVPVKGTPKVVAEAIRKDFEA